MYVLYHLDFMWTKRMWIQLQGLIILRKSLTKMCSWAKQCVIFRKEQKSTVCLMGNLGSWGRWEELMYMEVFFFLIQLVRPSSPVETMFRQFICRTFGENSPVFILSWWSQSSVPNLPCIMTKENYNCSLQLHQRPEKCIISSE